MNQKWKTLIVSVLTPSSIISGIALIVIWGYFSRLDRLDIFFDVKHLGIGLLYNYSIIDYDHFYFFYNIFFYTNSYSL